MSTWNRTLTLTFDVDAPYGRILIGSLTDTALLNTQPVFTVGDHFPIRIQLARRDAVPTNPAAGIDPEPGTSFVLAGKALNATGALLFYADSFSPVLDESAAPIPGLFQSDLDLNTLALAAHIVSAPAGPKTILCELEVRNAANTRRYSLQFDATARPQVYKGTEGVPLGDVPSYPAPSSLMLRGTTAPDLRLDITALTGGGATALDGLPTAGIAPPYLVGIVSGGALRFYLLTTSTAAEAAPGIIRPDDYAPVTNEKVWTQVL